MEPLVGPPRGKMERKLAIANRASSDLDVCAREHLRAPLAGGVRE
jgi:hypothetical protein